MIAQQLAELTVSDGWIRATSFSARFGRLVPLLPFVVPVLWSLFRLTQSVRRHRWPRVSWYARLLWTSLYTAFCLAFWAALQRGLTPNSQELGCRIAGQSLDASYYYSHYGPLPPLLNSSPCNGNYDLVPGWINPTIVICLLMTVAASVALMVSCLYAATEAADSEPEGAARGAETR